MEHRPTSLADQVFERLENEILSGKYARGEILTEMKLVNDLGVSRTPVREAVKKLELEHIVELSGKGIVVLGVSAEDVADIYAVRMRIEGMVAAQTARNITEEELGIVREALELQEYYVTRSDAEHIRSQDSRFHQLIYRFSGSTVFYDTLMPLLKKARKYRRASVEDNGRAAESAAEHRAIYEAVAAHNPAKAESVATEHVRNAAKHILGSK